MNASLPAGAAAATPALAVARALELRHGSHVAVRPSDFTLPARRLIAVMKKEPVVTLDMHLGEGSGAAVALMILRAALECHNGMATFAEAGIG